MTKYGVYYKREESNRELRYYGLKPNGTYGYFVFKTMEEAKQAVAAIEANTKCKHRDITIKEV